MFAIHKEHGVWPEVITLSEETWKKLWGHNDIQCRIRYLTYMRESPIEVVAKIFWPPHYEKHFEFRVDKHTPFDCRFSTLGGQLL